MSILANKETRLLVQGITGSEGLFHTRQMVAYGTNVVAGVTPGKGGEWVDEKIPVFDSVKIAAEATGANTSIIFVPSRFAADAIFEAADADIPFIVCITEGIPVSDMMRVRNYIDQKGVRLLGPNCPGLLTPGEAKVGIIPYYYNSVYMHPGMYRLQGFLLPAIPGPTNCDCAADLVLKLETLPTQGNCSIEDGLQLGGDGSKVNR